jgi:hypothetical protein
LREVKSARIVTDSDGSILAVHVVADTQRSPKQIARDVESMLVAKLGIGVDYRKISVAQIEEQPEQGGEDEVPVESVAPVPEVAAPQTTDARIEFIGVSVAQANLRAEARVELALEGVNTVASAEGADATDTILRLIAEATLEAIQRFFESGGLFSVTSVEHCIVGGKPLIVVNVSHVEERHERLLMGACLVSGDVPKATCLATLDAINRFLWRLTRREPTEYEIGPVQES